MAEHPAHGAKHARPWRSCDVAVVGAGIIGLAVTRALLARDPQLDVVVLEKESAVGQHASSRNSGVLHAGFYYSPDSLKARFTREGNAALRRFCADHRIAVRECGKVVVARSAAELPALDELARRGAANGVTLEVIDPDRLAVLEPLARTVDRALWSPSTAVADPGAVIRALAAEVTASGASVELGTRVRELRPGRVQCAQPRARDRVIGARHIVNAAGLYADRLAAGSGLADDYVILPFKGLYLYGNWPPGRLQRHVYPVPDARNPFLGVHLTVTPDGRAKIGPTAIPALSRENYQWLGGLRTRDAAEIVRGLFGFLSSDHHDGLGLIRSELPKISRSHMARRAAALVPAVVPADFSTRGRPGIRAQLFHLPTRSLEMDFVVRGDEHITHVLNAVSPGWTSALSFAELVADRVAARLT